VSNAVITSGVTGHARRPSDMAFKYKPVVVR